jgi:hypothetical protein
MTTQHLYDLLEDLADTREIVLRRAAPAGDDALVQAWRNAADDARGAYLAWCERPGRLAHAAYDAAEDRADAALAVVVARGLGGDDPHDPRRLAA